MNIVVKTCIQANRTFTENHVSIRVSRPPSFRAIEYPIHLIRTVPSAVIVRHGISKHGQIIRVFTIFSSTRYNLLQSFNKSHVSAAWITLDHIVHHRISLADGLRQCKHYL